MNNKHKLVAENSHANGELGKTAGRVPETFGSGNFKGCRKETVS